MCTLYTHTHCINMARHARACKSQTENLFMAYWPAFAHALGRSLEREARQTRFCLCGRLEAPRPSKPSKLGNVCIVIARAKTACPSSNLAQTTFFLGPKTFIKCIQKNIGRLNWSFADPRLSLSDECKFDRNGKLGKKNFWHGEKQKKVKQTEAILTGNGGGE